MTTARRLLAATVFAALALPVAAQDLTVVSYGGAYGAAQRKHMIEPFIAKTGKNVLFEDYSGGIAEMKAQVEAGNILWDVVDIEAIDLERACAEGLLESIPRDILPAGADGTAALEDFYADGLANECGVGVIFWSTIFAYNRDVFTAGGPQTIADLWDVAKFPGKRGFQRRPQVNLEWALIADGVPMDQVYEVLATPEGQDRAFASLDKIRGDIVWFDSWSQAPVLLNDGGASVVQSANGRIFAVVMDEKRPFEMIFDGQIFDIDVWAILKGSKNIDLAHEFIAFATGTEPLAGMQDVAYGPTRRSSNALIAPEVVPYLPSSHIDKGLRADGIFWADYGEALGERFNQWLLQ
ncbi:ABC transporter substrate-binding protein [Ruixingdingia sedimenti]|uniref:ABC transporter substrate-binding protein n=1 Tax=Ruixingdingia sedimenti TaxID=3073604 RepID=A0ABU1FB84_9RHOB|nr:ABC transporter substrate-binding protein [Xinfangfangia sp. LG-4]MDR5654150.1 ABC transporter substrate-binding protein [Xinfangfangia sp. LG-4]